MSKLSGRGIRATPTRTIRRYFSQRRYSPRTTGRKARMRVLLREYCTISIFFPRRGCLLLLEWGSAPIWTRAKSRPWLRLRGRSRTALSRRPLYFRRRVRLLTLPRIMLKYVLHVSNETTSREAMWKISIYRIGWIKYCSSIAMSRNSTLLLKILH